MVHQTCSPRAFFFDNNEVVQILMLGIFQYTYLKIKLIACENVPPPTYIIVTRSNIITVLNFCKTMFEDHNL